MLFHSNTLGYGTKDNTEATRCYSGLGSALFANAWCFRLSREKVLTHARELRNKRSFGDQEILATQSGFSLPYRALQCARRSRTAFSGGGLERAQKQG